MRPFSDINNLKPLLFASTNGNPVLVIAGFPLHLDYPLVVLIKEFSKMHYYLFVPSHVALFGTPILTTDLTSSKHRDLLRNSQSIS